ncbi:type VI secretion system tube protein Hcp [Rheinheimera sp.]|uniref:type VI secretion system tube protein Hcp n=1 Tax=Rheinheimera sp. TaxID=1869214 RepID=UPI0027BAF1EB|nr:type VI secretion system tube protein Hcp [Rheinheimera sp.]
MYALRSLYLGSLSAVLCCAGPALAEVKGPISLTINSVGTSEVLAWSWGASNSGSTHMGGGGGAGKANVQDISLTRYTDAQSVALLKAVATGQHFPEVEIKREGMRILLQDVLVTSYSVGGTTNKKEVQTENISLNFSKVTYELEKGEPYCFDIAANTQC